MSGSSFHSSSSQGGEVPSASPSAFIAPYILLSEYECPCCRQLPFDFDPAHPSEPFRELFAAFAVIRTAWGRPIPITSGYRCINRNHVVAGEELSAHLFGLALDLGVSGPAELVDLKNVCVSVFPTLRIGWKRYVQGHQNLVHIDVAHRIFPRPTPLFIEGARW